MSERLLRVVFLPDEAALDPHSSVVGESNDDSGISHVGRLDRRCLVGRTQANKAPACRCLTDPVARRHILLWRSWRTTLHDGVVHSPLHYDMAPYSASAFSELMARDGNPGPVGLRCAAFSDLGLLSAGKA